MHELLVLDDDGYNITITPEATLVLPFKALIDRDRGKDKAKAKMELAMIGLHCRIKSDYYKIVDEEERLARIIEDTVDRTKFKTWKPDDKFREALAYYRERCRTLTMDYYDDAAKAADALRVYFTTLDMEEVDDKGRPIHDAGKVINNIEAIARIPDALGKLLEKIREEMQTSNSLRAGRQKAPFEDPDNYGRS